MERDGKYRMENVTRVMSPHGRATAKHVAYIVQLINLCYYYYWIVVIKNRTAAIAARN